MFLQTRSGSFLDFRNPDPDTICIEDIAHALALTNRYNGHTPFPYSVAQHSVLASLVAPPGLELQALMHDAQEAYVGDMPSPLKKLLPGYQMIEFKLEDVIRKKFGLPVEFDPRVKEIDMRLLVTEAQAFNFKLWVSVKNVEPYPALPIRPWTWDVAKRKFLERFEFLTGTREELSK
jgi:hypothetical protein